VDPIWITWFTHITTDPYRITQIALIWPRLTARHGGGIDDGARPYDSSMPNGSSLLLLWLVGRRRKKLTRGANISCAQRLGGCWANWPHPRAVRKFSFRHVCFGWEEQHREKRYIGEGRVIASCLHAGNPPCLAMSVKMAKINVASSLQW